MLHSTPGGFLLAVKRGGGGEGQRGLYSHTFKETKFKTKPGGGWRFRETDEFEQDSLI